MERKPPPKNPAPDAPELNGEKPHAAGNTERFAAHIEELVESSDDAVIGRTLEGVVLSWNPGARALYGYEAEEAIGQPMTVLLPPDRIDEEATILARIGSGARVEHFETLRRTKSGELIDVSMTVSPIRDTAGVIVGASQAVRNVTERRRLEWRLHQLAAIVESAEDAIVSKTVEGVILTWNAAAERIYGYSGEEAAGKNMTMLLPDDRLNEEAEILERIRRGERVEHFETVRKTKSGLLIDVSLTISPIRSGSGEIVGASHVARDVSARKQLEEQLRQTQKLESLGVLAGGVAHDFNNLLTGILGNASLAMESVPPHHPVRGLLRDLIAASERASHLTRQLLAYAGKGKFIIEPIHLSSLVREIAGLVQTSIPKHVQLRLELGQNLPAIEGDASQMQQIVMNLVINGAEAISPAQAGTVLVTTSIQNVDEHYGATALAGADLAPGRYVSLDVHDTGCGMDEATLARIFDPFFTTKFTGRGLGLAAVQGIVNAHRGALRVYSRPGQGTTFKVLFPSAAADIVPAQTPEPHTGKGSGLILVIDDEEIIRRTAKSMLEHHGYSVVLAENGKEGVDLFAILAEKISVVVLDMTMPLLDGEETFRQLQAIRSEIPVVLSSGYNEVEAIRRFTGKGLAGFIQKPYSSASLREKIESVKRNPAG